MKESKYYSIKVHFIVKYEEIQLAHCFNGDTALGIFFL